MKQTQRHDAIIELVRLQGYVSTEELVEHFDVSPQTIRRDLNDLADQNKIQRHHGGAALPSSSVNAAYNDRKVMWSEEKARIAQRVASQIPDGATLFIDIGTTPEAVAHALMNHKNLRVVTNNLNVATLLTAKEDFRLILAGGEVRTRDGGIMGEATLDFISQFRLDYGILGISGIDMDARCSNSTITKCAPTRDYRKFPLRDAGDRPFQIRPQRHGQPGQHEPDRLPVYRPAAAAERDENHRTVRRAAGAVLIRP